jgi:hypothetical protein
MPKPSTRLRRGVIYSALVALPLATAFLTGTTASAVTGGTAVTDGSYPYAAKITTDAAACSGVLVDPRWVLTSSACFPDTTTAGAPAHSTTIIVGRPDLTKTTGHALKATSVIPRTDRNLALVRLEAAVTDVTPIPLATTPPQAGDTLRLAGFGRTATDWVPDQLHTSTVTIDSLTATSLAVSSSSGPTTCKGDAGGPAIRESNGQPELVALNYTSWQGGCLGETETRTGATESRTDDLHDWLVQQTTSPIVSRYLDLGGAASFLGNPVGAETAVAGGTVQNYEHGALYNSSGSGTHYVLAAILGRYQQIGGPAAIGFPTTDETGTPDGVGRYNHFSLASGASIYWTPNTGAHAVLGAIRGKWASLGWETNLGYPTTDETSTPDGVARYNDFSRPDGASIYWTGAAGAHAIQGLIRAEWIAAGQGPAMGYPTTDESVTPDGVGRYNHFSLASGASIYWTPNTGAHAVLGAIRGTWASLGWEAGRLGYPVSDEYGIAGGRRSDFQHGYITWTASNNTIQVFYY